METITVDINKIRFYKNNPRKNDGSVGAVAESITQCGYISPIIVDENMEVLAGHTRLKALRKLQEKQVEVILAKGLTEEQKRKFRILDNKTGEFSEWDIEKLLCEIEKVDFDGFEFGFDEIAGENFDEIEEQSEFVHVSFTLHQAQKDLIQEAIRQVKGTCKQTFGNENKNGNAIYEVVRQWAELKK